MLGNQLSGPIPPELGNLVNLVSLLLYGNELTSTIPMQLGNLTNLHRVFFSRNHLTGCIPMALMRVPENDFGVLGLAFCDQAKQGH